MKKRMVAMLVIALLAGVLAGCVQKEEKVKIGVSFGVGEAARWVQEKQFMEERAAEIGADIEVRLNKGDGQKNQQEDCREMIDGGIDVLILTPRDVYDVTEILDYAKKNDVKVISYARIAWNEKVDLFVGYDSNRMGQMMGQFLSELVYKGDYIILRGDSGDYNATLLYEGVMRYIDPIKNDINILLDAEVVQWSREEAKVLVKEAVAANGNKVDAILAPNDKLAGASREALDELGVTSEVIITGMDAETDALKRIIAGTQSSTIYLDLKELAGSAVDEAVHMAKGEAVNINAEFDNDSEEPVDANLVTGKLVTKENLDRIIIDGGHMTKEEIYGTE